MGLRDRDYMRPEPEDGGDDLPPRRPLWVTVTAVIVAIVFFLSALLPFF